MNVKLTLLVFLTCLLPLMILSVLSLKHVGTVFAQRAPGVEIGDTVKYGNFLASWASDNPNATFPGPLKDFNNTQLIVNTIQNVSGTEVTCQSQTLYKNGTDRTGLFQVDVKTGVGSGNLSFVSSNLVPGDIVYTHGDYSNARINMTFPGEYLGLARETNLLNVTKYVPDFNAMYWTEYYWDRKTGILVQQFWSYAEFDADGYLYTASTEYEMIENNIWIGLPDSIPPVANAGPNQTVEVGASVEFDASASSDNLGIASFLWSFGDGEAGNGWKTTHVYTSTGVYNATLTVKDGGGNSATAQVTITVQEAAPPPPTFLPFIGFIGVVMFVVIAWFLFRRR